MDSDGILRGKGFYTMTAGDTKQAIQELLHVRPDRAIGPETMNALALLGLRANDAAWPDTAAPADDVHRVKASTFADPADVAAFRRCKAQGGSDMHCFGKGDNGIGFTGLDCTDESIPYVALPPDYWKPRFGSSTNASGKPVLVTHRGKTVRCILGDTMPHLANITNNCGIDLAPGAQKAFGIQPGTYDGVTWQWA